MATETLSGPLGEVRSATTAGGGTALTSSAARIGLPRGAKQMVLIPRNFGGSPAALVVQFNKNPWLIIFKTTDALVDQANITDYSDAAQDSSTATDVTLSSLGTAAQGDFVYVGSWTPFGGVSIDVDAANGNASVLTVKYRKSDNTWATISATDGTDSGGASMGVDGAVTWTVPSDWITTSLYAAGDTKLRVGLATQEMFWTRWEWSAALDSSTTQNQWGAINRDTTYAEIPAGMTWEESITVGPGGIFSVTAKTDTSGATANLIINVATRQGGRF
jgi:hypothetical protein